MWLSLLLPNQTTSNKQKVLTYSATPYGVFVAVHQIKAKAEECFYA